MIDLKHYLGLLPIDESALILKYFERKKFNSLSKMSWFYKSVAMDEVKNRLPNMSRDLEALTIATERFHKRLDDEQLSFAEKLELVLEACNIHHNTFTFLDVKGSSSVTCICPKCKGFGGGKGKAERAWIPNRGQAKAVKCNHRSSCGFYGDLISVYAEEYSIGKGAAMNILADEFNVDLTSNEVHVDGTKDKAPTPKAIDLVPKVHAPEEIQYMEFDANAKFFNLRAEKYIDKYDGMSDEQQFKMIATIIYNYSLTTKQWGKDSYFKKVGITKKQILLKEKLEMIDSLLGFLHAADIKPMIEHLKTIFSIEDLVKYGVIHEENHYFSHQFKNDVQEGLVVVPNFDLYTSMCTGLKFRKTKLNSWVDKTSKELVIDKNKEPEFSFGRIANPLPYHLTRDALLNPEIEFGFFEGQKDLHSMPSRNGVCDVAIPGVDGINEEMLGLFKGRKVTLYFDQDEEGQKGAMKLKLLLEKAGAIVENKTWDIQLGADVNEVLQNGNILKIM
jgi:5S rRNA maturation endonuclease (ribonuclease M5)